MENLLDTTENKFQLYSTKVNFNAISASHSFELESRDIKLINQYLIELLSIFLKPGSDEKPTLNLLQQNTSEIRNKINNLVERYNKNMPSINALSAYFRKLNESEYFYVIPDLNIKLPSQLELYAHIISVSEGKDLESVLHELNKKFKDIFDNYSIRSYGHRKIFIGDKNNRLCRFCKKNSEQTTFKSKAHAISEALGNKTIILYDECDACNDFFSTAIEKDIANYLSFFRSVFDVKGKSGSKKLSGKNFELKNQGNPIISLLNGMKPKIVFDENKKIIDYKIDPLELREEIVMQNVYKSLCKYFLSTIDESEISKFDKTISWINGDFTPEKLPLIAETISYNGFSLQPILTTYIRKSENNNLPYAIGEFQFTCRRFIFIVPFSANDSCNFINQDNLGDFKRVFKNYKESDDWIMKDFTTAVKKKILMDIHLKN